MHLDMQPNEIMDNNENNIIIINDNDGNVLGLVRKAMTLANGPYPLLFLAWILMK